LEYDLYRSGKTHSSSANSPIKGPLGHRVFIIRKGEQHPFDKIERIEDLQTLTAGQGINWPDYITLKNNGLKVIGGTSFEGLFNMLQRGRFDYFPRGVNEPWQELALHSDKALTIEHKLLLRYAAPLYFFCNNKALQNRLERDLRLTILDGSFNQLLYNHPSITRFLQRISIKERLIFVLKTELSPQTEAILDKREFWYQPGEENAR